MNIAIVSDTSCNFTPETAKDLGVYIVPMQIVIDDHVYKDAIDITTKEFYQKMDTSKKLPTTSQPAIGEFLTCYSEIVDQYDHIISIHPSAKLSGTVGTARMAARQVDPDKITVVDSEMVSILSGYLVREAKRLVDIGKTKETILMRLEDMKQKTLAYIMLEDFENLVRSGRLPNLAGKLVRAARIKPILKISNAGIGLQRIVRTTSKAIHKVEEMTYKYIETLHYPVKIDVAHGNISKTAQKLKETLDAKYPDDQHEIHRLASVIGVHTGPGIVGFTMTPDYTKE